MLQHFVEWFFGHPDHPTPPRPPIPGGNRYASLGAHEEKDQSRKDDLESLLYVFLDLYTGKLPWAEHVRCLLVGLSCSGVLSCLLCCC